jgi:hypothetical protein
VTLADLARFAAQTRSFMPQAILTFILYWIVWVPGFIANLSSNGEAKAAERTAGNTLPGVGCLQVQFMLFGVLPIALLALSGLGFAESMALGLAGVGLDAAMGGAH